MSRRLVLAALALLVLAAAAGCTDDGGGARQGEASTATGATTAPTTTTSAAATTPAPSAGCGRSSVAPGTSEHTLRSGGLVRRYQLVVPPSHDGREPMPLVLALHALTVPHGIAPTIHRLVDDPDRPYVVAAPSGRLDGPTPFWEATPNEGNADLAFIDALLDRLGRDLCLDEARVFSTGMSNGGQMSSLLACRLDDRIAAVGPVAGVEFDDEACAGGPVPVMAFHGDADPVVPFDGGGLDAATIADQHLWRGDRPDGLPRHRGVEAALASWAAHNGCDAEPVDEQVAPDVLRRSWTGCAATTVLYVAQGHGHTLPGRPVPGAGDQFGTTTTSIDATALMLDLFLG